MWKFSPNNLHSIVKTNFKIIPQSSDNDKCLDSFSAAETSVRRAFDECRLSLTKAKMGVVALGQEAMQTHMREQFDEVLRILEDVIKN
jgi:hypothetical protein